MSEGIEHLIRHLPFDGGQMMGDWAMRCPILVSYYPLMLVNDRIACTPKGELLVKGIQRPVKVYEVLAQ